MNFKESLGNDLRIVFHNIDEFAENVTIYYDKEKYENIPAVIDRAAEDRSKASSDKDVVLYNIDVTAYIYLADLGFVPRKNHNIFINDEEFRIITAKEEMGEIVLELEALDE